MNLASVPPWRSTAGFTAAKYSPMTRESVSVSSRSPSAVEPTMSENRIVTVRRNRSGAVAAS